MMTERELPHDSPAEPAGTASPRKSPLTMVTPALSIATSFRAPMATPTWAWASAL